jgi:hypothetical protein
MDMSVQQHLRRSLVANNVSSALGLLLDTGRTFYAPLADKGSGEVSLVASGAGASQTPTFTRATTATTVDSTGQIISVASGVPRSYYDPTTLEYLGYLAEGARTNLLTYSEQFDNAAWSKFQCSVTADATTSPDGTATADKLVEDTSTSVHSTGQSISFTSGTTYTLSVWAKSDGSNRGISLNFPAAAFTPDMNDVFDISDGTILSNQTGFATIKPYPNGWYRCTSTRTATATVAGFFQLRIFNPSAGNQLTYLGDGTSGPFFYGAQLEAGEFPSSYIPTTTASVTRNLDNLNYSSSGNISETSGSFYAEVSALWGTTAGTGTFPVFVTANDNTTNNTTSLLVRGTDAYGYMTMFSGGVNQGAPGDYVNPVTSATAPDKLASSWQLNKLLFSKNGAGPAADTVATMPVGLSKIYIGGTLGVSNSSANAAIKNVRGYQAAFTAEQLNAITA